MTSFLDKTTNLLDMFIAVLHSSFKLKWIPRTLVRSQWCLNGLMQNCSEC